MPDLFGISLLKGSIDEIGGVPLINMTAVSVNGVGEAIKRSIDILFSFVGLIVLMPFLIVIFMAIKIDSRGPGIFAQLRYGVNGKEINVLKFRTMYVQENGVDVKQAVPGDIRVTRLGKYLRSTSLDELPQLLNVLFGTRSLVGRVHTRSLITRNTETRLAAT